MHSRRPADSLGKSRGSRSRSAFWVSKFQLRRKVRRFLRQQAFFPGILQDVQFPPPPFGKPWNSQEKHFFPWVFQGFLRFHTARCSSLLCRFWPLLPMELCRESCPRVRNTVVFSRLKIAHLQPSAPKKWDRLPACLSVYMWDRHLACHSVYRPVRI